MFAGPSLHVLLIEPPAAVGTAWFERTTSILTQAQCTYALRQDARTGADILKRCDAVLLHVVGPSADPLADVAELWLSRPDVPVVLLGDEITDDLRKAAYQAGIAFVMGQSPAPEELLAVLHMATEQNRQGSPELVRAMCRTMAGLSSLIATANDTSFLDEAVREIGKLFGASIVSVMLYDDEDQLTVVAQTGLGVRGRDRRARAGGVADRVAQSQEPRIIVRSARRHEDLDGAPERAEISASMCVPIPGASRGPRGRARGVINIARTDPNALFSPRDLDVGVSIAGLIGDALSLLETRDMSNTLQQRIQAVERLSAIGEIAGGIAHEVANPISCVRANVDVIIEYLKELAPFLQALDQEHPEVQEILDDLPALVCETWEGLARADAVVRQMKALVRLNGPPQKKEVVLLDELIDSTLRLLRPRLRVRVQTDLARGVCVRGSSVELSQVVVNLLVNAADACEERRQQEVAHGNDAFTPEVNVALHAEGDGCTLSIGDNGVGIAPAMMKRIFMPLFTTKPAERGTGLGLPIVRRVVEEHGGNVRVTSTVGVGTAFTVTLPLEHPAQIDADFDPSVLPS